MQILQTESGPPRESGHENGAPVTLSVTDLRKSFATPNGDRLEVLRGVSLEVRRGEAVAITGASGSGKSTLLHLLAGLDEPDHGSVLVAGTQFERLAGDGLTAFRQRHIGLVFQFHYLISDLTALENVVLPLLISRNRLGPARREARLLLTEMGLSERTDYPVTHLSGGEQQRVALARALIRKPLMVLADEPTGNLDSAIGDEIGKTLIDYVRRNQAIAIIATHNDALATLCDRVLRLQDGRLNILG